MLEIGEHFKINKKESECPLCKDKNSPDSQALLLMCPELDRDCNEKFQEEKDDPEEKEYLRPSSLQM